MKASELRIGNHIQPVEKHVTNFYTNVLGILGDKVFVPYEGVPKAYPLSTFEPIPLTEQWYIKFGFKKGYYEWEKGMVSIQRGYLMCYGFQVTLHKIEYVHQLQNLYFDLTGEELKAS